MLLGIWGVLYVAEAPGAVAAYDGDRRHLPAHCRNSPGRPAHFPEIAPLASPGQPLAPRLLMAKTRGVYAGPVTLTVLIPAHNEAASLPSTLASLIAQSQPPQRIIVVVDNCTDATADIPPPCGPWRRTAARRCPA
jgi:biofilm PGA synthesis N-glycosyltransferase PgaC